MNPTHHCSRWEASGRVALVTWGPEVGTLSTPAARRLQGWELAERLNRQLMHVEVDAAACSLVRESARLQDTWRGGLEKQAATVPKLALDSRPPWSGLCIGRGNLEIAGSAELSQDGRPYLLRKVPNLHPAPA